jgi:hypothetical protein
MALLNYHCDENLIGRKPPCTDQCTLCHMYQQGMCGPNYILPCTYVMGVWGIVDYNPHWIIIWERREMGYYYSTVYYKEWAHVD